MPTATVTQSTSTNPTYRVPLSAPYPANSYATVSYTDRATPLSIRVEDGPAPYLSAELPPHPQNSDYAITMPLTAHIYNLVEVAQDIATRRNDLIADLNIDPIAAMDNPRHNYFTLFREMKTKYPNATAGDVHQALKIAQQMPDQPKPAKLTMDEAIAMVPTGWTEDLRQDCIVSLLEAQPESAEAAETIIHRTRHRAQYHQRAAQRRHAELRDGSQDSSDLSDPLQQAIRLAIGSLQEYDAKLIVAKYIDAIPAKTIGEQLGISQLTFRKRLKIAEDNLRTILQVAPSPTPIN